RIPEKLHQSGITRALEKQAASAALLQATANDVSCGTRAVKSRRDAICSGRGLSPCMGAASTFSVLLYNMNTLARGHGEILPLDPCMVLQSKNTTEPAFATMGRIPPCSTSNCRLNGSGTPYSCFLSDCL